MTSVGGTALHWFRKGVRLHDNPALLDCCQHQALLPVYCLDPHFANERSVGANRYAFLLASLRDLDSSLRSFGSRLIVLRGRPEDCIMAFGEEHGVIHVTFESDIEPYARQRDGKMQAVLSSRGVTWKMFDTHTLRNPRHYSDYCASTRTPQPASYAAFCKVFEAMGRPRDAFPAPSRLPPLPCADLLNDPRYDVPTLADMDYSSYLPTAGAEKFPGGETEALRRLEQLVGAVDRHRWVCKFEKPNTSPNSIEPSTTVLSPYLKFGCLSVARFYHTLDAAVRGKVHTEPPVSLHGQLLWREFFYYCAATTPNFDRMEGNPACRQIDWGRDAERVRAWEEARTGYPFIDAIMTQLRVEGWIHHLARHAVACFLTRGDLYQHWEEGVRVFDRLLLDADWALNNANWQWLSCSRFFYQYFRVYSPVAFGKKTDPNGDYIRHWLPQLARYPAKYIYSPWEAPLSVQQQAGCIVGKDYPLPIVDHSAASEDCKNRIQRAYASARETDSGGVVGGVGDGDGSARKSGGNQHPTGKQSGGGRKRKADDV